jgi:hypothetical protein
MYQKCPKCLTVLGWKTEVCPECQYDVKHKIEKQPTSDFNEHVFPWLLLGTGIVFNLVIATLRLGPAFGLLSVVLTYTMLLVVQVPLIILGLLFTGRLFGIDYGSIYTGVVKLAGLCMFTSGLAALAQFASLQDIGLAISICYLMLPVIVCYLLGVLFQLSFAEAFLSMVTLVVFTMAVQFGVVLLSEQVFDREMDKPTTTRRAVKIHVTPRTENLDNR